MKKQLLILLSLFPLFSCSAQSSNLKMTADVVDAFGQIEFVGDQSEYTDTTYFSVDGVKYLRAEVAEYTVEADKNIGAVSSAGYTYEFYTIKDQDRSMLLVDTLYVVNGEQKSVKQIYISKECKSIPCAYLQNIPGSGGDNIVIQGNRYTQYGDFKTGLEVGDYFADDEDGRTYYKMKDHDEWLVRKVSATVDYFVAYYSVSITELPGDIVWATQY